MTWMWRCLTVWVALVPWETMKLMSGVSSVSAYSQARFMVRAAMCGEWLARWMWVRGMTRVWPAVTGLSGVKARQSCQLRWMAASSLPVAMWQNTQFGLGTAVSFFDGLGFNPAGVGFIRMTLLLIMFAGISRHVGEAFDGDAVCPGREVGA